MKTEKHSIIYGWLLVAAQFTLIAWLIFQIWQTGIPKSFVSTVLAMFLITDGLSLFALTMWVNRPGNWSVHPQPKAGARFITEGPYQWIRHPMYAAVILVAIGAVIWVWHINALLASLVLLVVLIEKIRLEERWMKTAHTQWLPFTSRTARLIPLVW